MRIAAALSIALVFGVGSLVAATQTVAGLFANQPALGTPIAQIGSVSLYPPWSVLVWAKRWCEIYPRPFALAELVFALGAGGGVIFCALALGGGPPSLRRHGQSGWARFADLRSSELFAASGVVLGKFDGEIVAYDGPGHLLLVGASRSGKGRGHVVPTLLAWPRSVLALDVKGELADGDERHAFPGVAGFRETLGPVLRFAPTSAKSARFNPLFEVRKGPDEVRDVQNIVDNNLGRLAVAIALSSVVSVLANESEDDDEAGLARSVGDAAAAQQAPDTGGRIVDRELAVHPTLRVRAGAPVRVLVGRDISLRPYRP